MATCVGYNCMSPLPLKAFDNVLVNDYYMTRQQQLAEPRKCQRTEQKLSCSTMQKLSHHSGPYAPEFWDDLSKIWLIKYALRELDRRNFKSLSQSSYQQTHRPVTRNLLAEQKKLHKPLQSAGDFLHSCSSNALNDIKLFARRGGLDLSDLRSVCIMRNPTCSARANNTT